MRYQTLYRPNGTQSVAYTGTAGTISNAVGTQTFGVLVTVTSDAFIALGAAPTATSSDMFIPANTPIGISINPGEKISAIQSSAGGTLYVTELDQ